MYNTIEYHPTLQHQQLHPLEALFALGSFLHENPGKFPSLERRWDRYAQSLSKSMAGYLHNEEIGDPKTSIQELESFAYNSIPILLESSIVGKTLFCLFAMHLYNALQKLLQKSFLQEIRRILTPSSTLQDALTEIEELRDLASDTLGRGISLKQIIEKIPPTHERLKQELQEIEKLTRTRQNLSLDTIIKHVASQNPDVVKDIQQLQETILEKINTPEEKKAIEKERTEMSIIRYARHLADIIELVQRIPPEKRVQIPTRESLLAFLGIPSDAVNSDRAEKQFQHFKETLLANSSEPEAFSPAPLEKISPNYIIINALLLAIVGESHFKFPTSENGEPVYTEDEKILIKKCVALLLQLPFFNVLAEVDSSPHTFSVSYHDPSAVLSLQYNSTTPRFIPMTKKGLSPSIVRMGAFPIDYPPVPQTKILAHYLDLNSKNPPDASTIIRAFYSPQRLDALAYQIRKTQGELLLPTINDLSNQTEITEEVVQVLLGEKSLSEETISSVALWLSTNASYPLFTCLSHQAFFANSAIGDIFLTNTTSTAFIDAYRETQASAEASVTSKPSIVYLLNAQAVQDGLLPKARFTPDGHPLSSEITDTELKTIFDFYHPYFERQQSPGNLRFFDLAYNLYRHSLYPNINATRISHKTNDEKKHMAYLYANYLARFDSYPEEENIVDALVMQWLRQIDFCIEHQLLDLILHITLQIMHSPHCHHKSELLQRMRYYFYHQFPATDEIMAQILGPETTDSISEEETFNFIRVQLTTLWEESLQLPKQANWAAIKTIDHFQQILFVTILNAEKAGIDLRKSLGDFKETHRDVYEQEASHFAMLEMLTEAWKELRASLKDAGNAFNAVDLLKTYFTQPHEEKFEDIYPGFRDFFKADVKLPYGSLIYLATRLWPENIRDDKKTLLPKQNCFTDWILFQHGDRPTIALQPATPRCLGKLSVPQGSSIYQTHLSAPSTSVALPTGTGSGTNTPETILPTMRVTSTLDMREKPFGTPS